MHDSKTTLRVTLSTDQESCARSIRALHSCLSALSAYGDSTIYEFRAGSINIVLHL
jgi:hypothetical protein